MKRMLVRLSLLTAVVVLGLIAIAEAQRDIDNPNVAGSDADSNAASPGLNDQPPGPATTGRETTVTVVRDATAQEPRGFRADAFARPVDGNSSRYEGVDASGGPPAYNPLAAELDADVDAAADDDFPPADIALGAVQVAHDGADELNPPARGATTQAERNIAQAPGADSLAPAPPATLPRRPLPNDDRQPYNPVRSIDDEAPAVGLPTVDRYGRPPAVDHLESPTPVGDPFASRGPTAAGRSLPVASDIASNATPERLSVDNAREGTGIPGAKHLEGQQVLTLLLHKVAPDEIQVGRPAVFEIRLRNTGTVPAHGVEIHDTLPKGTRLMATTPLANGGPQGSLVWELGTLEPGDEATVGVQLLPLAEGEIGSVASVRFSAEASVSTTATKPQVQVDVVAAESVMIGQDITLEIRIANTGSGLATNVIMEELVPEFFDHAKGAALEYEIGDLEPGEVREVPLTLTARTPGVATNVISVRAEGNLFDDARNEIHVIAPAIAVDLEGPKRRFLDREATYNVSISNPGTATAREIELVTYLPPGMEFVEANNQGQFDPATRAVYWLLEELPPAETGTVTLTTLPTEPGLLTLRVEGTAQNGLSDRQEREITVEGVAAILFQVVDIDDPIEAGGETAYEVRVVNQGSKAATNVVVEAILPAEMKPLAADGPTRYKLDGQRVLFDPLPRLAPKADTTYLVRAQALKAGDLRLMVRLRTDDMQSPVTKEESTRVFSDQ